jgi:hypothetical protein
MRKRDSSSAGNQGNHISRSLNLVALHYLNLLKYRLYSLSLGVRFSLLNALMYIPLCLYICGVRFEGASTLWFGRSSRPYDGEDNDS